MNSLCWTLVILFHTTTALGPSAHGIAVATMEFPTREACVAGIRFAKARPNTEDAFCLAGTVPHWPGDR